MWYTPSSSRNGGVSGSRNRCSLGKSEGLLMPKWSVVGPPTSEVRIHIAARWAGQPGSAAAPGPRRVTLRTPGHDLHRPPPAPLGGRVAEAGPGLVLGRKRRAVEVPDLPDGLALSVVAAEDRGLAEAEPDGVAAAFVVRRRGVHDRRAGALARSDDDRQDPLGSHVAHVAVDRDADVP